jgi:DNA-directed RNA polymerase subunit RPC12/RpoP
MEKQFRFQCWNCSKIYALVHEIKDEQKNLVVCPYCKAEGVVDLAHIGGKKKIVFRGKENDETSSSLKHQDPEILPTQRVS